jgi:segregation and condensation protein A
MSLSAAQFSTEKYQVDTPVYSGPLDLLLSLIERAELDITRLALAQVTDQYLLYLNELSEKDATEISYFLVIAAKLIQIKSEALLPSPPVRSPGEEDPGESLAAQLLVYKMFKESARFFSSREENRLSTYLHIPPQIKVEGVIDLSGITPQDLAEAARLILMNIRDATFGGKVIQIPKYSIREKIGLIISVIREKGRISFRSLLASSTSRLEVVVTFLALLELTKQNLISSSQTSLFGDIELEAAAAIPEDQDYDLEFGE